MPQRAPWLSPKGWPRNRRTHRGLTDKTATRHNSLKQRPGIDQSARPCKTKEVRALIGLLSRQECHHATPSTNPHGEPTSGRAASLPFPSDPHTSVVQNEPSRDSDPSERGRLRDRPHHRAVAPKVLCASPESVEAPGACSHGEQSVAFNGTGSVASGAVQDVRCMSSRAPQTSLAPPIPQSRPKYLPRAGP
jgi:hypothetical protein